MSENNNTDISDFIGMIIAFVAVIYTVVVNIKDVLFPKKRVPLPNREDRTLEEMRTQIEQEDEEEFDEEEEQVSVVMPLPVHKEVEAPSDRGWPRPEEKFVFRPTLEGFTQKSVIAERKLETHLHEAEALVSPALKAWGGVTPPPKTAATKSSLVRSYLKSLSSKKTLIIAHEIVRPCKGM